MHCTFPPGASFPHAATSCGPPTLSITTSTSVTPSSPTTTSASSPAARAGDPTDAITDAPACAASRTANRPTPPDAPVTSTRLPGPTPAARNDCSAANPATGNAAAWASGTSSGTTASASSDTATRSANAPAVNPTTRAPVPATTPATSEPSTAPGGTRPDLASLRSPRFNDTWCTSTSTSPDAASGAGTSATRTPDGAAGSTTRARIGCPSSRSTSAHPHSTRMGRRERGRRPEAGGNVRPAYPVTIAARNRATSAMPWGCRHHREGIRFRCRRNR